MPAGNQSPSISKLLHLHLILSHDIAKQLAKTTFSTRHFTHDPRCLAGQTGHPLQLQLMFYPKGGRRLLAPLRSKGCRNQGFVPQRGRRALLSAAARLEQGRLLPPGCARAPKKNALHSRRGIGGATAARRRRHPSMEEGGRPPEVRKARRARDRSGRL